MRVFSIVLLLACVHDVSAQRLPSAELGPPPQLPNGVAPESSAPEQQAVAAAVSVNPANRYRVSVLYRNVYTAEDTVTNGWNGTVAPCNGGATATAYQNATYERVNVFRTLAGLPGNVGAFASPQQPDDQADNLGYADNTLVWQPAGAGYTQPTQDVIFRVAITGITGGGAPASVNYTVTVINPYDAIFADGLGN